MTPMIKLVVKGIKTFIIIILYMFKKAEKSLILGKPWKIKKINK